MNVLVIGDEHTYGYGLPGGKLSYVGHFIRQISRLGQAVSVEVYAHLTMPQVLATLAALPLERYDLILLQLDHTVSQPVNLNRLSCNDALTLPYLPGVSSKPSQMPEVNRRQMMAVALCSLLKPIRVETALSTLLKQVRPYRHKVLLLTPFPHREPVRRWVSRRSRAIILQEADNQLVSVFDTNAVIQPREEYFLTDDAKHLSAISHELLGRSLFDFYESAPTIVTIQSFRGE